MARKSDFTEKKRLYQRFFEMKIPMIIIAKVMDIGKATVEKYYKEHGKKNSEIEARNTPANTQWNLLGVYTSFIADDLFYKTTTAGTRHDLLEIIEKELRLVELYQIILAHLRFWHMLVRPTFEDGVTKEEQKFISDWYHNRCYHPYSDKPTMKRAKEIAKQFMIDLHNEKIPFPTKEEFAKREEFYANLTESLRNDVKGHVAPVVTRSLANEVKKCFLTDIDFKPRHHQAIEWAYGLNWVPLDNQWQAVTKDPKKVELRIHVTHNHDFRDVLFPAEKLWGEFDQLRITREDLIKQRDDLKESLSQKNVEFSNELGRLRFENAILANRLNLSSEELKEIRKIAEADPDSLSSIGVKYSMLILNIWDLDLSVRAFNGLAAAKIHYLWQILIYDKNEIVKFRNFGKKSLKEIERMLNSKGLNWASPSPAEIEKLEEMTIKKDEREEQMKKR